MGQKVNPIGLRVGINRNWDSRWYANDKDFASLLHEDIKIRDFLLKKLKAASALKWKLRDLKTVLLSLFTHLDQVLLSEKMVNQ
jgi:SSU ribosomal protein S3P